MDVRWLYDTGANALCIFRALNPFFPRASSLSLRPGRVGLLLLSCMTDGRSGTPRIFASFMFIAPNGPSCFLRAGLVFDLATLGERFIRDGRDFMSVEASLVDCRTGSWRVVRPALNIQSRHVEVFGLSIAENCSTPADGV